MSWNSWRFWVGWQRVEYASWSTWRYRRWDIRCFWIHAKWRCHWLIKLIYHSPNGEWSVPSGWLQRKFALRQSFHFIEDGLACFTWSHVVRLFWRDLSPSRLVQRLLLLQFSKFRSVELQHAATAIIIKTAEFSNLHLIRPSLINQNRMTIKTLFTSILSLLNAHDHVHDRRASFAENLQGLEETVPINFL